MAEEPAILTGGKDAVPVLLELLQSRNQIVFRQAAHRLGRMPDDANPAVPLLIRATKSGDVNIRDAAAQLLKQLDPEAAAKLKTE
jgi:HEAT repeat protein